MAATAKIFMHGRSQAVRLPKEFRFEGREVRVTKVGDRVILEPMELEESMPWTTIDQLGDSPFMPEGREQPEAPAELAAFEILIHLDTNVAIALLNESSKAVREKFEAARAAVGRLCLSTIAYHELMYGAAYSEHRKANETKIALFIVAGRLTLVSFEEADAREAADIRAHLRRLATPIGPYDVLIAAQARRAGAQLVTANAREFARVPGLVVTDWAA